MGRRLFMHCNPNSIDWGRFTAFAASYKPNVCSIYEHAGRAVELARLCPDTLVMMRPAKDISWKTDPPEERPITPAEWVQLMKARYAVLGSLAPNIIWNTPNEPTPDNPAYIAWMCEVIREADRQNAPRLAILMASVGTPGEAALDSGMYDELIRLLARSRHFLCLHEYNMASVWFDFGQFSLPIMSNAGVQLLPYRQNFADVGEPARWEFPPYYHIGRFMWWNIKARELGVEPPSIWINEFGMDRCGDIENNPRIKDWERDYAPSWPDGAKQFRGAESYQWLWQHHQPDKTFYQFYWEQCAWYLSQLPANVVGVELFMAEESGNWQRNGYNVWGGGWDAFWQLAKDGQKEAVPMAEKYLPEVGEYVEVKPSGNYKVNIRATPNIKGSVVFTMGAMWFAKVYDRSDTDSDNPKLAPWYEISTDGFVGWVSSSVVEFKHNPLYDPQPAPQPDPTPDTVTLTITLTTAQMATLRDSVDAWRAVWEQIFPQVKGWED